MLKYFLIFSVFSLLSGCSEDIKNMEEIARQYKSLQANYEQVREQYREAESDIKELNQKVKALEKENADLKEIIKKNKGAIKDMLDI